MITALGRIASHRAAFAVVFVAVLAACSAASTVPFIGGGDSETASPSDYTIGSLPGQRLDGGQCGVFLWSRVPAGAPGLTPELVFFSRGSDGVGKINFNGDIYELPRSGVSGQRITDQFTGQSYVSRNGVLAVVMDVDRGDPVSGGVRLPSGTVRVNYGQWETVIPVAGLAGCQPESVG